MHTSLLRLETILFSGVPSMVSDSTLEGMEFFAGRLRGGVVPEPWLFNQRVWTAVFRWKHENFRELFGCDGNGRNWLRYCNIWVDNHHSG